MYRYKVQTSRDLHITWDLGGTHKTVWAVGTWEVHISKTDWAVGLGIFTPCKKECGLSQALVRTAGR